MPSYHDSLKLSIFERHSHSRTVCVNSHTNSIHALRFGFHAALTSIRRRRSTGGGGGAADRTHVINCVQLGPKSPNSGRPQYFGPLLYSRYVTYGSLVSI